MNLQDCAVCPSRFWTDSDRPDTVCTCCQIDGWSADGSTYKGWEVLHNPPPVPTRAWDWQAWHPEYDGWGDPRWLAGPNRWDLVRQIDEYERERMKVTS